MKRHNPPSWRQLLAEPGEDAHIVQLYQDDDFYGEAVSHFAAEGLLRGESVVLVATGRHWANISARLHGKGFDTEQLIRQGQLTRLDAEATLPALMAGSLPDEARFKPLARETIAKARAGGKYPQVRWWGEMVYLLYASGNMRASTRMDELIGEIAQEERVPLFCSFLMDKLDPAIYDDAFPAVCRTHSHVIPADDYVRHRHIVNQAIREVVGEIRGPLLQSLLAWKGEGALMPSSQAMLLWVKDCVPEHFAPVLARAREIESAAHQGAA